MSNGLNKPTQRQVQRSLSDRTGGLEQNLARALFGINQRFQGVDSRLINNEELVEALVELQGRADVEAFVDAKRKERAQALADKEKATLEAAVIDGYVVAADKVGPTSIIIGKYIDAAGDVIEPGRAQLVMTGVQEQFRAQLLDQAVGKALDLPNGEKFELLEIYSVDEEKFKAVMAAKQAAAVDDAAKAAAAASAEETAEAQAPAEAE